MSLLANILSSKTRADIFRLLFGLDEKEVHVREIERQTGLSIGTVRQELEKLTGMELVIARREGNRLYYRANTLHPLYPDIRNVVLKTAGLADVLKKALDRDGVIVAFVFGSMAQSEEGAKSDVDLMVIGEVTLRIVSNWLAGISEGIGREINPHAMSVSEFKKRLQSGEHFLTHVLESPKLFIIGSEDELARMGS
jgi:DNA-binding transcriptional ArsR family regulator